MGELIATLGNKSAGQLIRSEDWNALVAAVDGLSDRLTTVESSLTARLDGVSADLTQLRGEFDAFRSQTEPLLRQYFRVTMETTKLNFAIGELGTITARVTDLLGNPLDLRNTAGRPWIDFVAMWGQLRPAPGFVSRDDAGDRALSVQVNAEGIAQVQLRADHAEGFTQEEEDDIADLFTATLPDRGISVSDAILNARSPLQAKEAGAFQFLSRAYERPDTAIMRKYTDTYYVKNPGLVTGKVGPNLTQRWRDYRAIVLAFARGDDNPQTPDQSRGVSSIQVTFRDWIGPWVALDFLLERSPLVESLRLELGSQIHGRYLDAVDRVHKHMTEFARDKGVLGKLRGYGAAYEALAKLPITNPPDYLNELVDNARSAINFQQAMSTVQVNTAGFADQEVALETFKGAALRSERQLDGIEDRVGDFDATVDNKLKEAQAQLAGLVGTAREDFQKQVQQAETRFLGQVDERTKGFDQRFVQFERTLQDQNQFLLENFRRVNDKSALIEKSFESLNGRFSSAIAEGGLIGAINARVSNVEGQLGALNVLELNADELRQGAQRANLLWSLAERNRGVLPIGGAVGAVAAEKQ